MRVAIIGLGGVGGYLASYLRKGDAELVCFARSKHLEVIQRDGLTLIENDEDGKAKRVTNKLDARDMSQADGYFDLVIFCTKSYDLLESYKQISPFIDSSSVLLSFSNGVNNGDILRKNTQSIVLDACIYILSNIEQAGVIHKHGKVFSAVFNGEENATKNLKEYFESVNLRVKIPQNIQEALWKKYIFISAFGVLTTYYDESIVQVVESHFIELKILLKEISSVAKAKGIDIEGDIQKSIDIARTLPYDSSTSMHLDSKKGKKMELESLCGYIVKEADRHLIDTPFMTEVYKHLVM